jgi:TPR repeat protein
MIGINNVGMCYEYGFGVPKDAKKAFEYYQKAAALGSGIAMNNIGRLFLYNNLR